LNAWFNLLELIIFLFDYSYHWLWENILFFIQFLLFKVIKKVFQSFFHYKKFLYILILIIFISHFYENKICFRFYSFPIYVHFHLLKVTMSIFNIFFYAGYFLFGIWQFFYLCILGIFFIVWDLIIDKILL
jgi:hypothetical protein